MAFWRPGLRRKANGCRRGHPAVDALRANRTRRGGAEAPVPGRRGHGATCSGSVVRRSCAGPRSRHRCCCPSRVRRKHPRPSHEKPAVAKQAPAEADRPAKQAAPAPPSSACRLALTEEIAIAPSIPDIHAPEAAAARIWCGWKPWCCRDKRRVSLKPAAILRCAMASAIVDWIRADMAPLAASLGSVISDLDNFDSFECRGRNRVLGARTVRARPRQRA